ncbi:hypothetical protein EXIGLDRAFT_719654 [Exidia glandulosa HHB12029]|uniref:Uncharacterized protein n=1 Tax=Exidia glandulosa HHB12029 TaxID=1314781 RepID=A0A165GWM3_EXIGL|nr:hypothetical protein EXIGLDRAFT_719654 [Exidia glandulosa HHB12029]
MACSPRDDCSHTSPCSLYERKRSSLPDDGSLYFRITRAVYLLPKTDNKKRAGSIVLRLFRKSAHCQTTQRRIVSSDHAPRSL